MSQYGEHNLSIAVPDQQGTLPLRQPNQFHLPQKDGIQYIRELDSIKTNDGVQLCCLPCDTKRISLASHMSKKEPIANIQRRFYVELIKLARDQENLLLRFPMKEKVSAIIKMIATGEYGNTRKLKYNLPKKYRYKVDTATGERFLVNLKGLKIIPYEDLFKTIHTADVLNNHPSKEKLRDIVSSLSGNITKDMVSWYWKRVCFHCMAVDDSRKLLKANCESSNLSSKPTFISEFKDYTAQSLLDSLGDSDVEEIGMLSKPAFLGCLDDNLETPSVESPSHHDSDVNAKIDSNQITDACGALMNMISKKTA